MFAICLNYSGSLSKRSQRIRKTAARWTDTGRHGPRGVQLPSAPTCAPPAAPSTPTVPCRAPADSGVRKEESLGPCPAAFANDNFQGIMSTNFWKMDRFLQPDDSEMRRGSEGMKMHHWVIFFLFLTRMHPTDPGSAGCVKGPLNVYFKIFTAGLETHLTWVSPGPGRSSNMFLSCDRRGNFDSILGDFFGQVRQNVFTGRHSSARQSKSEKNSKSLFAFVKIKSNCLCHIARFKLPIFNVLIDNRKNANR